MTCMQCAITMGPCREDITQVTGNNTLYATFDWFINGCVLFHSPL